MSDQTEDHNEDEVVDYTTMTETELRERHATLSGLIDELRAEPRTLETARLINELRAERNIIVGHVRDLQATTDEADDDPLDGSQDEADEADDTEAEADTADAEDTTHTEEAMVSDTDNIEGATDAADTAAAIVDSHVASATTAERPIAPDAPTRRPATFRAGPGQQEFSRGEELDLRGLGRAFESRRTKMEPGFDGAPARAVVAGLSAFEDETNLDVPVLSRLNNPERNTAIMREASEAHMEARAARLAGAAIPAHTAAICEPLDIIRPIPEVGAADTPFANLFPQRPIGRLGFTFMPASSISTVDAAISVWTEDDQDAVDPDDSSTWKPCVAVTCGTTSEVKAKELTTCLTVDTATEMSSPERVKESLHLLGIQRSRRREQHVLGLWDATASGYTFTGTYGALPSLVQAVLTALPQLLYPEREDAANYDLVLEPGYVEKLTYDEHNQAYKDAKTVLAEIKAATGLNPVVLRDFKAASPFQTPPTPGGSSATLAEIPDANRVRIVPSGAYLYAATGEESTGWQTDPQLARQNKQQIFSAEWLLLTKHSGAKAGFIDITSVGNGSRACCTTAFSTSTYSGS